MNNIFTNTILGDYSSEPVEVTELPTEEKYTLTKVENLIDVIRQGEVAQKELDSIRDSCKHHYFCDEEGWPYIVRKCSVCKKTVFLI